MDKAARYYVYFLLAICILTALTRLAATRLYAQLESERLQEPKARRHRVWIGVGAIALSPLILLYGFWGPVHPWMWLTVGLSILSGAEQWTAARCHEFPRMLWHTRIFGVISALLAVGIYVFFLRK